MGYTQRQKEKEKAKIKSKLKQLYLEKHKSGQKVTKAERNIVRAEQIIKIEKAIITRIDKKITRSKNQLITRVLNISVLVKIVCCRDGIEAYRPEPQTFYKEIHETKKHFRESLIIWRDHIVDIYDSYLRQRAEDECEGVGTRRLCIYDDDWSDTEAFEIYE